MHLYEYLTAALSDLVCQKLRTLLTMLGIIFGVGAVISMLSIGAGVQAEALRVIDSMGLRNIIVREKQVEPQDLYTIRERSLGLSLRDLSNLRRVVPDLSGGSGRKRIRVDPVRPVRRQGQDTQATQVAVPVRRLSDTAVGRTTGGDGQRRDA